MYCYICGIKAVSLSLTAFLFSFRSSVAVAASPLDSDFSRRCFKTLSTDLFSFASSTCGN